MAAVTSCENTLFLLLREGKEIEPMGREFASEKHSGYSGTVPSHINPVWELCKAVDLDLDLESC